MFSTRGASTSADRERGKVKLSPSEAARETALFVFFFATWPFFNVSEILQMCANAQEVNDAAKYGPFCVPFFFLLRHEADPTEPVPARHVSTESLSFFAQPDAQHSARNHPLSKVALGVSSRPRSRRSLAAGNGFVRAPKAQEQALRVLHAQGLHAPGLFLPPSRTSDWLCVLCLIFIIMTHGTDSNVVGIGTSAATLLDEEHEDP